MSDLYISWDDYNKKIEQLAIQVYQGGWKFNQVVCIAKGGMRVGDVFVAGPAYGKVRAMSDDKGLKIVEAGPSIPVEIIGLTGVPFAGDEFIVINNEIKA